MPVLINYVYNPSTSGQELYGLVTIKKDQTHEIWLASTQIKGNFHQWQLLKLFKEITTSESTYDKLTTMQIKDNYIYITNRKEKSLSIISIEDVNKVIDEIKLPAEVVDSELFFQIQSLFIESTASRPGLVGGNLYLCVGNKILLNKPEDRKAWTTFYEGNNNNLIMIKANADIMAIMPYDTGGLLYLAPMGSNNFQEHRFLDNTVDDVFYGVFFNSRSKLLVLLDRGENIRTFNYKVNPDKTITISAQIDIASHYGWGDDLAPIAGILVDATALGGSLNVGVVLDIVVSGGTEGVFQPAGINSSGKIVKKAESGFGLVDTVLEYTTTKKLTLDTHGPIFFLNFNTLFYTSTALGKNWVQEELTFSKPTPK